MKNVLLIEPNRVLARTYRVALEHVGYQVSAVTNAQEAIDTITGKPSPDVVVLEPQLTEHSGIEFLHEFRSYSEWQKVPVVIHTLLDPRVLQLAKKVLQRDLGVCVCLYKPRTSLEQLLAAVREATV